MDTDIHQAFIRDTLRAERQIMIYVTNMRTANIGGRVNHRAEITRPNTVKRTMFTNSKLAHCRCSVAW